jgi:hypothetical protein
MCVSLMGIYTTTTIGAHKKGSRDAGLTVDESRLENVIFC